MIELKIQIERREEKVIIRLQPPLFSDIHEEAHAASVVYGLILGLQREQSCLDIHFAEAASVPGWLESGWRESVHFIPIIDDSARNFLLDGNCPKCQARASLLTGPAAGVMRDVLCVACHTEFNVGPLTAEVIASPADRSRLEEYGLLRRCSVCGCTRNRACIGPNGIPCHWVAWTLCSECQ